MNAKIQITLSKEVLEALQKEAAERGISPAIFTRMLLHERYNKTDAETKAYTVRTRNWREIEAYVRVRNLGSVESFIPNAIDLAISRNRLSAKQKAEFEKLLGE
jgi:deoxyribodipyrimidine photolyase